MHVPTTSRPASTAAVALSSTSAKIYTFGRFVFRLPQRTLESEGQLLRLGDRAAIILSELLNAGGETVSSASLHRTAWAGFTVDDGTLRVHIANLRRVFAKHHPDACYIANESGRGYRMACHVHEQRVTSPGAERPLPVPTSQGSPRPARANLLHGRMETIERLRQQLDQHRFLSIVGPGGIGKTSVALAIADAFEADGTPVYFADFAPILCSSRIDEAVALALGQDSSDEESVQQALSFASRKGALLLLDNCEHHVDIIAVLSERLLHCTPKLRLLATSREPLRADGELPHRLEPLSLPAQDASWQDALQTASVALFIERASAVWPGLTLGPNNVGVVGEICRQLDGLPLAIELAATCLEVLDLEGLLGRLRNRFHVLTGGRRTAARRQQTLRATMDWSYALLTHEEQAFLRSLGIFCGRFDLADARAVASPDQDDFAVLSYVQQLHAKSLITVDRMDGAIYYRLSGTNRDYALEKLEEAGELETVRRRHIEHFLTPLTIVSWSALDETHPLWRERQIHRLLDIRAAIGWSVSAGSRPLPMGQFVPAFSR